MLSESELSEMRRLVRETMKDAPPFKPSALFVRNIDEIVVTVRNCSFMESPSDQRSLLVFFEDDPAEGYAGFAIDYAYLFCYRHNLIRDGVVLLSEMLDAIAGAYPEERDACTIAQDILKEHELTTVSMEV